MATYDRLKPYLTAQTLKEITLTFRDIEEILGGYPLPRSAERPQWWANTRTPGSHVQREAWRAAGYDAFLIAGSRKVRFQRVR
jgi:hypothetical protein